MDNAFHAEENTMTPQSELSLNAGGQATSSTTAPSVDFINAISEFFETDPSDLLVELGYYQRDETVPGLAE